MFSDGRTYYVTQIADKLGVCRMTIYNLVNKGLLKPESGFKPIRISGNEINGYIRGNHGKH